jgi:hypothetical protein
LNREQILENIIKYYNGSIDLLFFWEYYQFYKKEDYIEIDLNIFRNIFPKYYGIYHESIIRSIENKYNIIKIIENEKIIMIK